MTVELTIQIPDSLDGKLHGLHDRLPEILDRGLRNLLAESSSLVHEEHTIIEVLTSQPTPEQILELQPSPELQARADELLAQSKQGQLPIQEAVELERYLLLEHLVRMAKAHAYRRLALNV